MNNSTPSLIDYNINNRHEDDNLLMDLDNEKNSENSSNSSPIYAMEEPWTDATEKLIREWREHVNDMSDLHEEAGYTHFPSAE